MDPVQPAVSARPATALVAFDRDPAAACALPSAAPRCARSSWLALSELREGRLLQETVAPRPSSSFSTAQAAPARVAVVGDSIAFNFRGRLARSLQSMVRAGEAFFVNEARGSETTCGLLGLEAVKGTLGARMREILRKGYDEIVLEVGINELASGWPAEQVAKRVRMLCEEAMEAGVRRIVLLEVMPWKGFYKWTPKKAAETRRYNALLAELAQERSASFEARGCDCSVQLVRLSAAMASIDDADALQLPARYPDRTDGLHPGHEGIDSMAETVVLQAFHDRAAIAITPEAMRLRALRRELADLRRRLSLLPLPEETRQAPECRGAGEKRPGIGEGGPR